jgi:GTP-binding protein
MRWLNGLGLPYLIVATKVDKLSQSERARLRRTCLETFGAEPLAASAVKGDGLDELWQRLHEWTS